MKYLCLVYLEEQKLHAVPDRECVACGEGLRTSGLLIAAEALQPVEAATSNHSYFPVTVSRAYALSRDGLYQRLKDHGILSRRYFYPLISNMPMYRGVASADPANLPVANTAADSILCLPIYPALAVEDQARVIRLIADAMQ